MRAPTPLPWCLLLALLFAVAGCAETELPDDDDTTSGDDDDSSTGDDDDSSAGDDDDSAKGDDDDSTAASVQTPATHQLCAAAGKSSADGITMTTCFGPTGLAQGSTSDGTITLHSGAFRQVSPQ